MSERRESPPESAVRVKLNAEGRNGIRWSGVGVGVVCLCLFFFVFLCFFRSVAIDARGSLLEQTKSLALTNRYLSTCSLCLDVSGSCVCVVYYFVCIFVCYEGISFERGQSSRIVSYRIVSY